jgi:glycosyltransferase involved in cell wall biosynthesis
VDNSLKVSVVLSFYNEEDVLSELINRLANVFESLKDTIDDYELIFVNDASTDRSKEILMEMSKSNKGIKIINMSRNFGVSECVLAGMKLASGDGIIYMDADLQDPPELIPEMVKIWLDNNMDVVNTRRKSRAGETRIKLWITDLGYTILNKTSNIEIEPQVGDFKLLSRRAVNELIKLEEKRPFMRGLTRWIGFKQETICYNREPRYAGRTKFVVISARVIGNFLDSALISFSSVPLKISLIVGFLVSMGAFCFLIGIFVMKFMGLALPGWAAIMATMLMLGGIQLFTMGMLGLYVNSIYIETKGRPNYIVESTHGFNEKP